MQDGDGLPGCCGWDSGGGAHHTPGECPPSFGSTADCGDPYHPHRCACRGARYRCERCGQVVAGPVHTGCTAAEAFANAAPDAQDSAVAKMLDIAELVRLAEAKGYEKAVLDHELAEEWLAETVLATLPRGGSRLTGPQMAREIAETVHLAHQERVRQNRAGRESNGG